MNEFIQPLWHEVLGWTQHYGYHAVIPSLLLDPAGVPWGWIVLMLLAESVHLNVPVLLFYGLAVMIANDVILYALGYWGGRPLINWLGQRFPQLVTVLEQAEAVSAGRGILAVTFGRFLPLVGRWVGAGAGLANVHFVRFLVFDIIGAVITVFGFGLLAHFVGRALVNQTWFPTAVLIAFVVGVLFTIVTFIWNRLNARRRKFAEDNY